MNAHPGQLSLALDIPAIVRPRIDPAALVPLQQALCTLRFGDALVGEDYRVERFIRDDGREVCAMLKGGNVRNGVWHGGEIVIAEVAKAHNRRWLLRKFALALAWRSAFDCCVWRGGAGLDRGDDAPQLLSSCVQLKLAI